MRRLIFQVSNWDNCHILRLKTSEDFDTWDWGNWLTPVLELLVFDASHLISNWTIADEMFLVTYCQLSNLQSNGWYKKLMTAILKLIEDKLLNAYGPSLSPKIAPSQANITYWCMEFSGNQYFLSFQLLFH